MYRSELVLKTLRSTCEMLACVFLSTFNKPLDDPAVLDRLIEGQAPLFHFAQQPVYFRFFLVCELTQMPLKLIERLHSACLRLRGMPLGLLEYPPLIRLQFAALFLKGAHPAPRLRKGLRPLLLLMLPHTAKRFVTFRTLRFHQILRLPRIFVNSTPDVYHPRHHPTRTFRIGPA